MNLAELGKLEGQIAVRLQAIFEDLNVTRAVHRLDDEGALVVFARLGQEHVFAEGRHVAGSDPQRRIHELRRVDFDVAGSGLAAADIAFEDLIKRPALRVPEHRARRLFLEVKQVHLAAEPAMIALFRLFDLLEVRVELFLLGEGGAVDAAKHFAVGVSAPIGTRDLHQFESVSDLAGRVHVWPAAEVKPVALLVDLDLLIFGDGVDELHFEQLALVPEHTFGLFARPNLFCEGFVARDDLAHFLFNGLEILGRERLVAEEVVVEAVLDHWTDGDLGARPQRLHGFGEHVRGVVPDQLQRARILPGEEFDFAVALYWVAQIREHAVERHRDGALGERRRDFLGNVETGGSVRIFATRAIGEGQRDHRWLLLLTRCLRMQVSVAGRSPRRAGSTPPRRARRQSRSRLYDAYKPCNAEGCLAGKRASVSVGRLKLGAGVGAAPAAIAPG